MITKMNNWMLNKQAAIEVRKMEAEDGQTMVEYGLVLVAVAIAALAAYSFLGDNLTTLINSISFT
jgi:Flp pilus assembly pilin Flp